LPHDMETNKKNFKIIAIFTVLPYFIWPAKSPWIYCEYLIYCLGLILMWLCI